MPTTSTTKTKRRTRTTSTTSTTTTTRKGFLSLSLEAFCAPYRLLAWTCKPTRRRHHASGVRNTKEKAYKSKLKNVQWWFHLKRRCCGVFFRGSQLRKRLLCESFFISFIAPQSTFLIQLKWKCNGDAFTALHWYIAALKMRISWTGKKERKIAFDDTSRFRKPFVLLTLRLHS